MANEITNHWKETQPLSKEITAKDFDEKFEKGKDDTEYLDFGAAVRLKDIKKLKNSEAEHRLDAIRNDKNHKDFELDL